MTAPMTALERAGPKETRMLSRRGMVVAATGELFSIFVAASSFRVYVAPAGRPGEPNGAFDP